MSTFLFVSLLLVPAGEAHEADVGVDIAVHLIKSLRPCCDGVHIMPGRLGDRVPEIIRKAGLN